VEIYGRVRQDTDDNIIGRMRTACRITNAKHTHTHTNIRAHTLIHTKTHTHTHPHTNSKYVILANNYLFFIPKMVTRIGLNVSLIPIIACLFIIITDQYDEPTTESRLKFQKKTVKKSSVSKLKIGYGKMSNILT
jgi:hypothetical protein